MKPTIMLLLLALLSLPATVVAANHEHGSMQHGTSHDMKGHDAHGGMDMGSGTIMLPEQTVEGITAMVHIKDVKAAMAKMGMKHTHHFMVMFKDSAGKHIEAQVAAVKIVAPDGKEGEAIELPSMQGHSGADVILVTPGTYSFKVAARLPGDKKVQYEFKHTFK